MKTYQFIRNIARLPFVNKIIIFGSRARNQESSKSDIDLAIDCPGAPEFGWLEILDIVEVADTLLSVDCIRLDTLSDEDKLKKNILKQGKCIYLKDEGGFVDKVYWKDSFQTLGDALARLIEAFDKTKENSLDFKIYRDACIQRFQFTTELFWKVLKKFLNYEKINAKTPREVLQESYMIKIIQEENIWLEMMTDRNLTSHTYKESLAQDIFSRFQTYLPLLEETYKELSRRFLQM